MPAPKKKTAPEKTQEPEPANENMVLWNQVCETDPAITKYVNTRGGFTAICAQSQLKRATALWGSYGDRWGIRHCRWFLIRGDGHQAGKVLELTLEAEFFYPHEGTPLITSFEISSDIAYAPGQDCRKKLLTDVTTKALSKLGFNSDVFEGKYDDNKYVQGMREKYADEPPAEAEAQPKPEANDGGKAAADRSRELTDAKKALEAQFASWIQSEGVQDEARPILLKVIQQVLGRTVNMTVEDVELVRQAILGKKYTATGEKVPEPEPSLVPTEG